MPVGRPGGGTKTKKGMFGGPGFGFNKPKPPPKPPPKKPKKPAPKTQSDVQTSGRGGYNAPEPAPLKPAPRTRSDVQTSGLDPYRPHKPKDPPDPKLAKHGINRSVFDFNDMLETTYNHFVGTYGRNPSPGLMFDLMRSPMRPEQVERLFEVPDSTTQANAVGHHRKMRAQNPQAYFVRRPDGHMDLPDPLDHIIGQGHAEGLNKSGFLQGVGSDIASGFTSGPIGGIIGALGDLGYYGKAGITQPGRVPTRAEIARAATPAQKKFPMVSQASLPFPGAEEFWKAITTVYETKLTPQETKVVRQGKTLSDLEYHLQQAKRDPMLKKYAQQRSGVQTVRAGQEALQKMAPEFFKNLAVDGYFTSDWAKALKIYKASARGGQQQVEFDAKEAGMSVHDYVKAWKNKQRLLKENPMYYHNIATMDLKLLVHPSSFKGSAGDLANYIVGGFHWTSPAWYIGLPFHAEAQAAKLAFSQIGASVDQFKAYGTAMRTVLEMQAKHFNSHSKTEADMKAQVRKALTEHPTWAKLFGLDMPNWADNLTNIGFDMIVLGPAKITGEFVPRGNLARASKSRYLNSASDLAWREAKKHGVNGVSRGAHFLESESSLTPERFLNATAKDIHSGKLSKFEFQDLSAHLYAHGRVEYDGKVIGGGGGILHTLSTRQLTPKNLVFQSNKARIRNVMDRADQALRGEDVAARGNAASTFLNTVRNLWSHVAPEGQTRHFYEHRLPQRIYDYSKSRFKNPQLGEKWRNDFARARARDDIPGMQKVFDEISAHDRKMYPSGRGPGKEPFDALFLTEAPSRAYFPTGGRKEVDNMWDVLDGGAKSVNDFLLKVSGWHRRTIVSGAPIPGIAVPPGGVVLAQKHAVADTMRRIIGGGGIPVLKFERNAYKEIQAFAHEPGNEALLRRLKFTEMRTKQGETRYMIGPSKTDPATFDTAESFHSARHMKAAGGYVRNIFNDDAITALSQSKPDDLRPLVNFLSRNKDYRGISFSRAGLKEGEFVGPPAPAVQPRIIGQRRDPVGGQRDLDLSLDEHRRLMPRDREHLYHVTDSASLERLRREGLRPGKERAGETTGVYLAEDGLDIVGLLPSRKREGHLLLRVNRKKVRTEVTDMYKKGSGFEEHVSRNAIPPQAIEYLGKDGAWHPLKQGFGAASKVETKVVRGYDQDLSRLTDRERKDFQRIRHMDNPSYNEGKRYEELLKKSRVERDKTVQIGGPSKLSKTRLQQNQALQDQAEAMWHRYAEIVDGARAQGITDPVQAIRTMIHAHKGEKVDQALGKWISDNKVEFKVRSGLVEGRGAPLDGWTESYIGFLMTPNKLNRAGMFKHVMAKTYKAARDAGWEKADALEFGMAISERQTVKHMLDFSNMLKVEQDLRWASYFATKHRLYWNWVQNTIWRRPGLDAVANDFQEVLDDRGNLNFKVFGHKMAIPVPRILWLNSTELPDVSTPFMLAQGMVEGLSKGKNPLLYAYNHASETSGNIVTRDDQAWIAAYNLVQVARGKIHTAKGAAGMMGPKQKTTFYKEVNQFQTDYRQQHGHYAPEAEAVKVALAHTLFHEGMRANFAIPTLPTGQSEKEYTANQKLWNRYSKLTNGDKRYKFLQDHPALAAQIGQKKDPEVYRHNQEFFGRFRTLSDNRNQAREDIYQKALYQGWTPKLEAEWRKVGREYGVAVHNLELEDAEKWNGSESYPKGMIQEGQVVHPGPWGYAMQGNPFLARKQLHKLFPNIKPEELKAHTVGQTIEVLQAERTFLNTKAGKKTYADPQALRDRLAEISKQLAHFQGYPKTAAEKFHARYFDQVNVYRDKRDAWRDRIAALPADKQDRAYEELRAWEDSQDKQLEVHVAGKTIKFPSPVRVGFELATPDEQRATVVRWASDNWDHLSTFAKHHLTGKHIPAAVSRGQLVYQLLISATKADQHAKKRLEAEYNIRVPTLAPGESLDKEQRTAIARQVDQIVGAKGAFMKDYNFAHKPTVTRMKAYEAFNKDPQWTDLFNQVDYFLNQVKKAGYTGGERVITDVYRRQIVPQLKARVATEGSRFRHEVGFFVKQNPNFWNSLISP